MKNKNLDLNDIKTDLEIKLVKVELQKLKLKKKNVSKDSKTKKITSKKSSTINKPSKKVALKKDNKVIASKANNSKNKKPVVAKKVVNTKNSSKKKPIKKLTTPKAVLAKKTIKPSVGKRVVVTKKTQTKTPKPVVITKTDSKKVIVAKGKTITKKERTKKNSKLLLLLLLPIFALALGYYFKQRNKLKIENQLILKEKEEKIDYNENTYFKEVEDEVADEELQDFNIFKDVADSPETNDISSVVSNSRSNNNNVNFDPLNNSQTNIVLNDNKNNEVINSKNSITNSTNKNLSKELLLNELKLEEQLAKNDTKTSVNTQTTPKSETSTDNESTKSNKRNKTKRSKGNLKITSNIEDISAMRKVNGKLIAVNNTKKANSFRINLKVKQTNKTGIHDKVEFMLVIKNQKGKTVKIDVKKVNFSKNKNASITFSETLLNKISTKKEYTFYIYANKKLIEKTTKKFN